MHTLPPLPYAYDALEPYIDEQTMHVHHDKHHQTYVDNLNKALDGQPRLQQLSVEQILTGINAVPEPIRAAVRNNGGGVWNHTFFWNILKKDAPAPTGQLLDAITRSYGSVEKFKEEFKKAALSRFGSGWAWLVVKDDKSLEILSTPNQDSPISDGKRPLLCVDVWEHAYYLKYQNRRADYVDAFFHVIDWSQVARNYELATK